jgi:uncharacterized protein YjbJ (UPF0337 family)
MDWDRIRENWKHVRRKVKEKWGKLTEADLAVINGRRGQLEGKIHQRYGFAMDHVRKEVDDWFRWQPEKPKVIDAGPRRLRQASGGPTSSKTW